MSSSQEQWRQKKEETEKQDRLDSKEVKAQLDHVVKEKAERTAKRTRRIENIELNFLRLKWAFFLMFILQIAIFIKSFHHGT
ncbi:hypothetical protein [Pleurocapsa sp. PCC 7319]|uniref:hypothetical protein n=1 Tax=Pleurocapsa sp. PCC 7319 TaxID=118161 RepID=UPI000345B0BE|nr:hypothetical protein [Pleurocapsa sp. PCC 7319]